jgi:hypothetical protein
MDPTIAQWRFKEGDQVVSADDHKLGKVVAFYPDMVNPTHFVVEKGLIFHHDYYVPISSVSNYEGNTIYVDVRKDAVLNQGWDMIPSGPAAGEMPASERTM